MPMLSQKIRNALVEAALQGKTHAYAPYSNFPVGAALLCGDGTIVTGASIDNASWSLTICAERTALVKAVSEGIRSFTALAVVANVPHISPCGLCRQVIVEFCAPEMPVLLIPGDCGSNCPLDEDDGLKETTVGALFPDNDYH
ncbi:cytidine deaminase [Mycena pura]|uniref:Cytidine deaminase n=1 Tax=Mycena pura TaxID=153505 RepID=A0AAD7E046_9AGAR|nr:cytidine deaminase [Mycena pura]